jgi:hypothetical protein
MALGAPVLLGALALLGHQRAETRLVHGQPASCAISMVWSIGKPNVSCSWKASAPANAETPDLRACSPPPEPGGPGAQRGAGTAPSSVAATPTIRSKSLVISG